MEIEPMGKYISGQSVVQEINTLLGLNYLTRATLPRENAEKCTSSSAPCPSVYPNDPTINSSYQSSRSFWSGEFQCIKDGAFFCYCAYVLRISRYSGFLWMVPPNAGIFLCGLKLGGESRT